MEEKHGRRGLSVWQLTLGALYVAMFALAGNVPVLSAIQIIPGVPIVSTVSGRTDREERREMPRIGPFVWERPIAESSVFCNLRRFYRFAAKIHAQSQAGGLSFAGFRNTLFP